MRSDYQTRVVSTYLSGGRGGGGRVIITGLSTVSVPCLRPSCVRNQNPYPDMTSLADIYEHEVWLQMTAWEKANITASWPIQ